MLLRLRALSELTEWHNVYRPLSSYRCFRELVHCFAGHVNKVVFALWLSGISISDLKNDCTSFFLDVIKQVLWRLKDIEKEVNRLLFLGTVKELERCITAGDTGNVLAVNLEVVGVATEGECVLPPNPASI
jgi:hypothetical protein